MAIITLLTDFGTRDEFVGVMKGVVLSILPSAVIVDISHHVDPQNIRQAAYMIPAVVPYFPGGTVHTVVVDPGVGSGRCVIAARIAGQVFLAPDNGALSVLLAGSDIQALVQVENSDYFLSCPSRTFHGRDIFAPVAAHLAGGIPLDALGPALDPERAVRLPLTVPKITGTGQLRGAVIAVDRFGNLITNIASDLLDGFCPPQLRGNVVVEVHGHRIGGIASHYAAVPADASLALVGSRNLLEIAVNGGRADIRFNARVDDPIVLTPAARGLEP